MTDKEKIEKLRIALQLLLNDMDYTIGNCRVNEMVGAVVERAIIKIARQALEETE